jgi:hypothetical protein
MHLELASTATVIRLHFSLRQHARTAAPYDDAMVAEANACVPLSTGLWLYAAKRQYSRDTAWMSATSFSASIGGSPARHAVQRHAPIDTANACPGGGDLQSLNATASWCSCESAASGISQSGVKPVNSVRASGARAPSRFIAEMLTTL